MPSIRKYSSNDSNSSSPSSSHESKGRHSSVLDAVAFSSQSTAPTSLSSGSPRLQESKYNKASPPLPTPPPYYEPTEDLSPSTLRYPRASVDTYVSGDESEEEFDEQLPESALDLTDDDDVSHDHRRDQRLDSSHDHRKEHRASADSIPPLPEYRHDIVDRNVCPSTPQEFAQLFPSLDRMSVRHDEFTADGNMNLRVDVSVPMGRRRILTSYQLFHLRMYDLAKREFSLRRYSRDSGREVCNSKLNFIDPSEKKQKSGRMSRKVSEEDNLKDWGRISVANKSGGQFKRDSEEPRPGLQRSMTTALRSLGAMATKPSFRRSLSSSSSDNDRKRPSTSHSPYSNGHSSGSDSSRPYLSSSTPSLFGRDKARSSSAPPAPKPTNTIKLEFSNYARVDLELRGGPSTNGHDNTRYEFEWWGHKYTWKRAVEKHLNVVSYHLLRDDNGDVPIAHIVPEMRSPNQVDSDERAGGWIPPCHMWIADPSVLEAFTDVADVIVSTGLITLTDDCIRTRWQPRKAHGLAVPLISRTLDMDVNPRALMQHVFHRRNSHGGSNGSNASPYTSSPLRHAQPTY